MKRFITLFALFVSAFCYAQPAGYTEGQLRCWNYNGRDHLYGRAEGWDPEVDHILIFFGGTGQTTCTGSTWPNLGNLDDMAPGTIMNDGGTNWNMITNGGGVKWLVFFMRDWGTNPTDYANDIAYFFQNATMGFDTAQHHRLHIAGGSIGPANAIGWLQNTSVAGGNPYRKIFSTGIWMSSTFIDITADYPVPYNYCWNGTGETQPPESYHFANATLALFNNLPGTNGVEKFRKTTSGTGHSNATWGDCFNVTGTDSSTNRWIWMAQHGSFVPPPPENKITGIQFSDMIDLSGGSGNPYSFFNEQSTTDPENGTMTAATSVSLPNAGLYYPGYFGHQWRFAANLRGQYHVKKLWYYVANNNGYFDDSLFVYKTSDFLSFEKIAGIRIAINTPPGWYNIALDDTTKYVVFGLKRRQEPTFLSYGSPDVRELILYGDLVDGETRAAALPIQFPFAKRPKKTIGNLVAVNVIGGYEPMHNFTDFAGVRIMNELNYIDDSLGSLASGTKKFNADHWNEYFGGIGSTWRAMEFMFDSMEYTTKFILPEWNANSQKVTQQAGNQICWTYNNFGDNPLALASYTETGYASWNLAAKFGAVAVDSNRLRLYRTPRVTGMNLKMHITIGSEINRFWGVHDTANTGCKYTGNLQYMVGSQMNYDGHENQFGDSIGVKNADPNMKLGYAADYKMDSIVLNSRIQLSRAMRSDNKNVFGSFQFNEYPEKIYSDGMQSAHAVEFGLAEKVQKLVDYSYRMDSSMLIYWTENGMDANPNTEKSTPKRTGTTWTDRQWQAIMLGHNIVAASKTNVDGIFLYVLVTNSPEEHGGTFQTSDLFTSYPAINYKPAYYYVRNMIRAMKNYRHEATVQSQWRGLCIEKYRHATIADSVIYAVSYADTTGLIHTGQTIPLPGVQGTPSKVDLSFTSFTNTISGVAVASGAATMDVGEKMFLILASEAPTADNIIRRKKGQRFNIISD